MLALGVTWAVLEGWNTSYNGDDLEDDTQKLSVLGKLEHTLHQLAISSSIEYTSFFIKIKVLAIQIIVHSSVHETGKMVQ